MREKERGGSSVACPFWTSLSCSSSNEEDKQQTLTTCYSVAMAIKCKSILTLSICFFVLTLCDQNLDFVYARVPCFCSSIFVVRGCSPHEITTITELIHLRRFCLKTKENVAKSEKGNAVYTKTHACAISLSV